MTRKWDARPLSLSASCFQLESWLPGGHGGKMKALLLIVTVTFTLFGGRFDAAYAQSHSHVIQMPSEAQWGPAPPMLPAGAQIAVLSGDPTKAVAYTVRLKFPANYAIPAHSHPGDEHVVVSSGALTIGMGDKLTKKAGAAKTLPVG